MSTATGHTPMDPAPITYAGVAGVLASWGLQLSDMIALASLLVAVCGLILQGIFVYYAIKNKDD